MAEIISDKSLKRGRIAADNATTGVSKGHDKEFNKIELSTTSPDKPESAAGPAKVDESVRTGPLPKSG